LHVADTERHTGEIGRHLTSIQELDEGRIARDWVEKDFGQKDPSAGAWSRLCGAPCRGRPSLSS
jgi:hypothetical protein